MPTKTIALFATPDEYKDFLFIKTHLERNSDADTIRAMISYCKKNFTKNNYNSNKPITEENF